MAQQKRTPEERLALAAVLLLCLQMAHETYGHFAGSTTRDLAFYGSKAPFLLALFAICLVGLWERSPLAWWFSLFLFGALGLLHAMLTWPMVRASLRPPPTLPAGIEYEWIKPFRALKPFELFWVCANSALLLAVPLLLAMDHVRRKLRKAGAERIREPE